MKCAHRYVTQIAKISQKSLYDIHLRCVSVFDAKMQDVKK